MRKARLNSLIDEPAGGCSSRPSRRRLHHLPMVGVVLVLSSCSGPIVYRDPPVSGRVTDADTGKPVEGVVVAVAREVTWSGTLLPFKIEESVTGPDGNYSLPGGSIRFNVTGRKFENSDLLVLTARRGYGFGKFENKGAENGRALEWGWNGEDLPIKPFAGTPGEALEALANVATVCARTRHPPLKLFYDELKAMSATIPNGSMIDLTPCLQAE